MTSIKKVEGIGETYALKLQGIGIFTVEGLLKRCASAKERKEVAEKQDISEKLLLEWVNHADLFRVHGVGEEYADLLEEAGVDTVPELAQRNAQHLYEKLLLVNNEKKLVRRLPLQSQVEKWVEEAKQLPRVITY